MIICTGYYGGLNKYSNLNSTIFNTFTPISISGKAPNGWKYPHYKKLAPSYIIWKEYNISNKTNIDKKIYSTRFYNEILNKLDIIQVLCDLATISDKVILCCYEKPEDFCHRHLVAYWLNYYSQNIGSFVIEFDKYLRRDVRVV